MTDRAKKFLKTLNDDGPCLVVDLNIVKEKFLEFRHHLPTTDIYYAVKANPAPEILKLLTELGACFDAASTEEIRMCLMAGATADRISFGNTIKKQKDIAEAFRLGVRLFAFDSKNELQKIAEAAPNSGVIVRLLCECEGADWPLSRKFGCSAEMAHDLLIEASKMNLIPRGISFHVGSQQGNPRAWDDALHDASLIFKRLEKHDIYLDLLNLGGGFPARYIDDIPNTNSYTSEIDLSLKKYFGDKVPKTLIEPGRGMVGDAGVIQAEVILISKKAKKTQSDGSILILVNLVVLLKQWMKLLDIPLKHHMITIIRSPVLLLVQPVTLLIYYMRKNRILYLFH